MSMGTEFFDIVKNSIVSFPLVGDNMSKNSAPVDIILSEYDKK